VFSSVGLERYLDRVEVMGSNPLTPTSLSIFRKVFLCFIANISQNFKFLIFVPL
jgi:hypothetical protein